MKSKILIVLEVVLLGFFLFWHFYLGVHRYFDVDEFAHLHWAFNAFSGLKPYTDFLYFFPPLFLYLFSTLFIIVGKTAAVVTFGRIVIFVIFLLLVFCIFFLIRRIKGTPTALLTIAIFSFLPLPFDKFLEIRPDSLALLFALIGMYFLVESFYGRERYFLSGLFYALSVATLPKLIFFVPVAIGAIAFWQRMKKFHWYALRQFFFGFCLVGGMTLFVLILSGNFQKAFYLTVTFANQSSNLLGKKFPMHGSLFFYPNDAYYGIPGVSAPLLLNLIIYIVATVWGVWQFVSFFDRSKREESLSQFLLAGTFLLNFIAYMKFFPLKHAQYLISLAPFVSFYFADFIMEFIVKIRKRVGEQGGFVFLFFVLILILFVGWQMNMVKKNWTNEKTFAELKTVQQTIPAGSFVFDLFGETIFYKDPYYVCCIPYGQYAEVFSFKLPNLSEALRKTGTKYVFLNREDRLKILPPMDEKFIRENYAIETFNPMILKKVE